MGLNSQKSKPIIYPDSDGQPIADNTLQFRWIVTLQGGIATIFRDDPNVFVAGDLLWYPVEGDNKLRQAPDVMVALGRPKGDRGSYKQWEEGGVAPQVVFEVLSLGNRAGEMNQKRRFYEQYGVQEYYLYDPYKSRLTGWQRRGDEFEPIADLNGWTSPLLGIRFVLDPPGTPLQVFGPDGRPFVTVEELSRQRQEAEDAALVERLQRELAEERATQVRQQLLQERQQREQAEAERQKAEARAQKEQAERQQAEARAQEAERQIQEMRRRMREAGLLPEDDE